MSFRGKLLVEKGSMDSPSQDWGDYEFLSSPSPGDRIAAQHEGAIHYLTVLCVHHSPVALTGSQGGAFSAPPTAEIVAKWTGHDG